jgi:hypothetical protein
MVSFHDQECRTPCLLEVSRGTRPVMLRFNAEGREAYTGEISPHAARSGDDENSGVTDVAAVVSGLLIVPMLVDFSSGTFYDWPRSINAVLPLKGQGGAMLDVNRKPVQ